MENKKEKQLKPQEQDRSTLWAILFTICAFIVMAILSRYI
jgi:hypothetical protein